MQQHNLVQGSPEWKAHRAKFNNASDTPSVLGISKHKSRSQLMHERHTGEDEEHDAATQKRFDDGHRFERLSRPIAAKIIGKSLYPVTGTEGKYGASFDGLTINEDIAFEHKTINNSIRACESCDDLDEIYLVQMEHQLMVSGAEMCLFMATKWDEQDNLLEQKHFFYYPDLARRQKITDAWDIFNAEEAEYVPVEVIEKPKAEVVLELPALFIQASGAILASNMEQYGTALANRLAEVRSIKLITDQDFSNAKEGAKKLRENIKQAKLAKDAMLEQTATVGEAARMIDAWCEDMRLTALKLETDVEAEDKLKKRLMINEAQGAFTTFIQSLDEKVWPIRLNIAMPDFSLAIKGKSKYSSMQDAIDTLSANATSEANRIALDVGEKLAYLDVVAEDYRFLFNDIQQIIFKADDDFKLLVNTRIKNHREAEDKKAEHIKAQAEAEARYKVEKEQAEIKAKAEAEARAKEVIAQNEAQKPVTPDDEGIKTDEVVETNSKSNAQQFPVSLLPTSLQAEFGKVFQPTAHEIVSIVARAKQVDEQLAHKWLLDTDFATMMQKAA